MLLLFCWRMMTHQVHVQDGGGTRLGHQLHRATSLVQSIGHAHMPARRYWLPLSCLSLTGCIVSYTGVYQTTILRSMGWLIVQLHTWHIPMLDAITCFNLCRGGEEVSSAGYTPAWESHVLAHVPLYTALLPLFLRQTAARASQYGNPVLEDLKHVCLPQ